MSKLYPIGTQLITRRLSQAALYMEVFGEDDFSSYIPVPETYDGSGNWTCKPAAATFVMKWIPSFYSHADAWRVMVTAENQKWLSPVPMVGDLVDVDRIYSIPTTIYVSKYDVGLFGNPKAVVERIIERTYPNGQRAPMLEWDEVIEPKVEGRK